MVDSIKAALWSLTPVALLLCSGGCVMNEFVAIEGLGLAGCEAAGAQPVDPYYVPPCTDVYAMDPAFYGYHPTCWTPWPEGWTGCPPCVTAMGAPIQAPGQDAAYSPPMARPPSVLDELEPPLPESTDWDIVPSPAAAPPKPHGGMPMPRQTGEPRRIEAKAIEPSSPFREEAPPPPKAMEVPAETGPSEDAARAVPAPQGVPKPAPVKAPAPLPPKIAAPAAEDAPAAGPTKPPAEPPAKAPTNAPAKAPAPLPSKAPAPVPADSPDPLPQDDESARGTRPGGSPAIRMVAETDADRMGRRVAVPREDLLPAPLPEDVLTATAIWEEPEPPPRPLDSVNETTAAPLPTAPLPCSAADAGTEHVAGWAFCSDAG